MSVLLLGEIVDHADHIILIFVGNVEKGPILYDFAEEEESDTTANHLNAEYPSKNLITPVRNVALSIVSLQLYRRRQVLDPVHWPLAAATSAADPDSAQFAIEENVPREHRNAAGREGQADVNQSVA